MSALNFLQDWVLPPRVYKYLAQVYLEKRLNIAEDQKRLLSKNLIFKDKYRGRRCFVIGNGPSLNKQDLSLLKGEITIVMNQFHRHPILRQWQPTFYCAADPPETYLNNKNELNELKKCQQTLFPEAFFFPLSMKEFLEKNNLFPPDKTYFVKMGIEPQYWNKNKKWDFSSVIPGVRTTAHLALYLALFLGCSPVYLLGLDNDWLSHRSVYRHFYSDHKTDPEDEAADLSKQSYKMLMENTLQHWIIFERVQEYAAKEGIKIFNATEGSFLDVFPEINYLDLFKQE
jgi:hypothetical protein